MKRSPLLDYYFFDMDILAVALHHKLPTDAYRVYSFISTTTSNAIATSISLSVEEIARYCDLSQEITYVAVALLKSKNLI